MSLQQIKNLNKQRGFTIVELLIVIVVIGILAAIVIVAFNGVQNQAKATQRKADAQSIVKLAEAYNADDNAASSGYPDTAARIHGYNNVKLPTNVRVAATPLGSAAAAPTTEAATMTDSSGVRTYTWKFCSATNGIIVYYWDPSAASGSNVKSATAGAGC